MRCKWTLPESIHQRLVFLGNPWLVDGWKNCAEGKLAERLFLAIKRPNWLVEN